MKLSSKTAQIALSSLTAIAIGVIAPAAYAVSLTVTNDVHVGTFNAPDSGFSLTQSTGNPVNFGDINTRANVSASATGATSLTSSDAQTSPFDQSGAFAFATVLPGDVLGSNSAADGVANWIELQNFNAAATATYINDGTPGLANATSDYLYQQFFTVDAGATVNYHFDFAATFGLLDPPVPGKESAFGKSFFQFMLVSTDLNGRILDSLTYDKTLFGNGYFASDLNLAFADGFGYWQAFTSAEATATVPEPGTFLLVGAGLAGLAIYRRRRNA